MNGRRIVHIFIDGVESKPCSKCGQVFAIAEYYRSKITSDGLRSACKGCEHKANAAAYARDPDYAKGRLMQWAKENPERMKEIHRQRWLSSHRKAYCNAFHKKMCSTPKGIIDNRMRLAIHDSLRGGKGGRKWSDLVGYGRSELVRRLSETMPAGYSWERISELHIDHIVPISFFKYDSADDPQFRACWALENLQFLPAAENLKKSNKMPGMIGPGGVL